MKRSALLLFILCAGCSSLRSAKPLPPQNIPKPSVSENSKKVDEGLERIGRAIKSADTRVEKIKLLLEALDLLDQKHE